jgi:hypothetical protein
MEEQTLPLINADCTDWARRLVESRSLNNYGNLSRLAVDSGDFGNFGNPVKIRLTSTSPVGLAAPARDSAED